MVNSFHKYTFSEVVTYYQKKRLLTLNSVHSTKARGAEQMTETTKSNQLNKIKNQS